MVQMITCTNDMVQMTPDMCHICLGYEMVTFLTLLRLIVFLPTKDLRGRKRHRNNIWIHMLRKT